MSSYSLGETSNMAITYDKQIIPFCRSEFLQNVSIELGRRLKHISGSLAVEVDICEHEGDNFERLSIWIFTSTCTRISLTLWDDGTVLIGVALLPSQNNKEYEIEFYPLCKGFSPEKIVEALRDTISISSQLCYNESPLEILRQIWKHTGDVKVKGTLPTSRKAQP